MTAMLHTSSDREASNPGSDAAQRLVLTRGQGRR